MFNINRNDPCPCGSGKKFKKCHMGREEELILDRMEHLPEDAAQKVVSLPEVSYGRIGEFRERLDIQKLSGTDVGVRFIDLKQYLTLDFVNRQPSGDLNRMSAGQMVNPIKTLPADSKNIYVAVSPAVSDSTLVHQLAHALDYLAGSKINPGLARPLAMELDLPMEILEHPKEYGDWLVFLANELNVRLDAEDTIVAFLQEKGFLIPGSVLEGDDHALLKHLAERTLNYLKSNRTELDARIKGLDGYRADQAPQQE